MKCSFYGRQLINMTVYHKGSISFGWSKSFFAVLFHFVHAYIINGFYKLSTEIWIDENSLNMQDTLRRSGHGGEKSSKSKESDFNP
jgi:hypothetical protein